MGARLHLTASGLIMVLFMAWVLPEQAASSAQFSDLPPPDLRFVYSAAELSAVLDSMGEAGREAYIRSRYAFDVAWPLAYTYFFLVLLAWAVPRAWGEDATMRRVWPWVATAPFALDMVENSLTGLAAHRFPDISGGLALAASSFTAIKWCSVGVCSVLVLASLAKALRGRSSRGTQATS